MPRPSRRCEDISMLKYHFGVIDMLYLRDVARAETDTARQICDDADDMGMRQMSWPR